MKAIEKKIKEEFEGRQLCQINWISCIDNGVHICASFEGNVNELFFSTITAIDFNNRTVTGFCDYQEFDCTMDKNNN